MSPTKLGLIISLVEALLGPQTIDRMEQQVTIPAKQSTMDRAERLVFDALQLLRKARATLNPQP